MISQFLYFFWAFSSINTLVNAGESYRLEKLATLTEKSKETTDSTISHADEFSVFTKDDSGQDPSGENDTLPDNDQNKKNKNKPGMFYLNLNLQKQFGGDSIFLPEPYLNVIDSWVFLAFLRYSDNIAFTKNLSFVLRIGLGTTNQNSQTVYQVLDTTRQSGTFEQIQPNFHSVLSFTKLYAYEANLDLNFSGSFFLKAGFLPLLQGNSFFKNPVSFFERYFPQKQFYQEYSAFSAPAISLDYFGSIYSAKLLYKPAISTWGLAPADDKRQLAEYLGINIPGHVLMFKNTLHKSPILSDLFFFTESPTHYNDNFHFGLGSETTWNIIPTLSLQGQILYSNGINRYESVEYNGSDGADSFNYYSLEIIPGSMEDYRFDTLAQLKFSGISGYEISLTYYYNGHGLSESEYNSLIEKLKFSRERILAGSSSESLYHQQFFYPVLSAYDIFSLRQHYLFLSFVDIKSADKFTWGVTPIISIVDLSLMITAHLNINISTNGNFYLQVIENLGEPESVFFESILKASIIGGIEWKF
jgi:hypothetical protein